MEAIRWKQNGWMEVKQRQMKTRMPMVIKGHATYIECTEGANVLTMQGIALVIAGSMDIVCDANLLTSLDQDELVVLPICNEGA